MTVAQDCSQRRGTGALGDGLLNLQQHDDRLLNVTLIDKQDVVHKAPGEHLREYPG